MKFRMTSRQLLRQAFVTLLWRSGYLRWVKSRLRSEGAVIVVVLHRVLRESDYSQTCSQPEILVTERTFRNLMEYAARNYETPDLHEAVPGQPSKRLKVVFTFDDGWWDNYSIALPIAKAHNVPLTIFVCPNLIEKNMPFWPERAIALLRASNPPRSAAEITEVIEQLKQQLPHDRGQALANLASDAHQGNASTASMVDRTLSAEEIRQMNRAGVRFGSHTHSHEILTNVPLDIAREQIEGTDSAIEKVVGKPCTAFSYPNGNWSETVRNVVADAGFKLAVTTDRAVWRSDTDPLAIPRANVCEEDLIGLDGSFCPALFEYVTICRSWWRSKKAEDLRVRKESDQDSNLRPEALAS